MKLRVLYLAALVTSSRSLGGSYIIFISFNQNAQTCSDEAEARALQCPILLPLPLPNFLLQNRQGPHRSLSGKPYLQSAVQVPIQN
jgi:hypothetical protein